MAGMPRQCPYRHPHSRLRCWSWDLWAAYCSLRRCRCSVSPPSADRGRHGLLPVPGELPRRGTLGLIIGFVGIALLLRPGSGLDFFGVAVIVGGQIAWAMGAEFSPRVGLPEEPRLAAGLELLAGGAVLFAFSAAFGDLSRLNFAAVSSVSWIGSLVYRHRHRRFHRLRLSIPEGGALDRHDLLLREPNHCYGAGLVSLWRTYHLAHGDRRGRDRRGCLPDRVDEIRGTSKDAPSHDLRLWKSPNSVAGNQRLAVPRIS